MSEPIPSHPPGGRTAPGYAPGTVGRIFSVLCWSVFVGALAIVAAASLIRIEHLAGTERRYALGAEQRTLVAAIAKLVDGLVAGTIPAMEDVSALRTGSLDLLARIPPGPVAGDLSAAWRHLVTGLDRVGTERARILETRTELEELRTGAGALEDATAKLADALSSRSGGSIGPDLSTAARLFAEEVQGPSLVDSPRLDRAAVLLDLYGRTRGSLAVDLLRQPDAAAVHAALESVDAQLGASRAQVDAARESVSSLQPVAEEIRRLADASEAVAGLLPRSEALATRPPTILGRSVDDWLLRAGGVCIVALIGLAWRRQRLHKAEMAALDRAWAEAAGSDWRARSLVRDLVRAIGSVGSPRRPPATAVAMEDGELDESVRAAARALPRIVARRARLAATVLAAREPLRRKLSAARDAALGRFDAPTGRPDAAPLLELDATLAEATLFAMAALARELRAAVSEHADAEEASVPDERTAVAPEGMRDVVGRGFELLERCLEQVLDGEEEERTALLFLIDDLRTVRGHAPLAADFDFNPAIGDYASARAKPDSTLQREAARMLPSFQKGLQEWMGAGTDGNAAAKLLRGSASVLAHSAKERAEPADPVRGFWSAAAAFCTALSEDSLPSGPAVRRILEDVAGEFRRLAEGESEAPPPAGLFRELLAYVALTECDHQDLEEARAAFDLDPNAFSLPESPERAAADDRTGESDVSRDIIRQLEGIRAALDRINHPSRGPAEPVQRT